MDGETVLDRVCHPKFAMKSQLYGVAETNRLMDATGQLTDL